MTPEHLIAIASAGEWGPVDNEDRHDTTTLPALSKRTHSALDALASLCVRVGKGEVYAVGMRFSEINSDASDKIILTIAGDGNVPVEVSSHLRALWMQLQEIAKVRCKHYKHQGMPYTTYSEDSPSSKNAFNGTSEMLQRLKTDVFRHSLQKFVGRLDKRYDAFLEFSSSLQKYWLQQPKSDEDARIDFVNADLAVRTIKKVVSIGVEDVNLDLLLTAVNELQPLVHALVKSRRLPSWCTSVAKSKSLP